jgi:hypothetical protein
MSSFRKPSTVFIIGLLLFSSCATGPIPLNCNQHCALQEMICVGVTDHTRTSTSQVIGSKDAVVTRTSGRSFSCRVPETDSEREQLAMAKVDAQSAVAQNAELERKKAKSDLIGFSIGFFGALIAGWIIYAKNKD